ncbi:MAG: class I SAM-dependent methyltransferase [Deltaproteobacteria bacterium]|nr:class I SAM-dependent methyltransferase [Deltaproteobacteria bacterium]
MTRPTEASYDEFPYPGAAFWFTHPDHMAVLAELHGMSPPDPRGARVLELGCGDGSNILSIAQALPGATCVGVDLSESQVRIATRLAADAGITNARLVQADVREIDRAFGEFDFVISHGVYSWIPPGARDGLLRAIGATLSPHGVAMVSYNAMPGWHDFAPIRRLLKFHTDPIKAPDAKVRQARMMADVYCQQLIELDRDGREKMAHKIHSNVQAMSDWLMRHDWLAEFHYPVYVSDFVAHAREHGLDFLANACPSAQNAELLDEQAKALVMAVSDRVRRQQYVDFFQHTRFRTTLLRRADAPVDDEAHPERIATYLVESRMDSDAFTVVPPTSDVAIASEEVARLEREHHKYRAVVQAISKDAPAAISMERAFDLTLAELVDKGLDEGLAASDEGRQTMRDAFVSEVGWLFQRELVHFWKHPPRLARTLPERPETGALQRVMARDRQSLPSLTHRNTPTPGIEAKVLADLDGALTVAELEARHGPDTGKTLEQLLAKGFVKSID